MIGKRYAGFIEATAFDTGYRRACSDLLDILEKTKWTRIVKGEGMELLRVLCVPENLEAVATGDAKIYHRTNEMVKDGKERYHVHFRIQAGEPDEKGEGGNAGGYNPEGQPSSGHPVRVHGIHRDETRQGRNRETENKIRKGIGV